MKKKYIFSILTSLSLIVGVTASVSAFEVVKQSSKEIKLKCKSGSIKVIKRDPTTYRWCYSNWGSPTCYKNPNKTAKGVCNEW